MLGLPREKTLPCNAEMTLSCRYTDWYTMGKVSHAQRVFLLWYYLSVQMVIPLQDVPAIGSVDSVARPGNI